MATTAEDGSIIASDGRILYYSWRRFVDDICLGDNCFICGRAEVETVFNREHILPNWMLHQFGLHNQDITLPNGTPHRYGIYTLPCCERCNGELSRVFETPLSAAFAGGFAGIDALLREEGSERLFVWMALIFLKLHLKDGRLREHRDRRLGDRMIGDQYIWENFHHLHALVRVDHTGAEVDDAVFGSLMVMELHAEGADGFSFDMASLTEAQALYLRLGDVALFAIFNDSCASLQGLRDMQEAITGPLNPLQAREFFAQLAACNLHLENRPCYSTQLGEGSDSVGIVAHLDPNGGPRFAEKDQLLVGSMKHKLLATWVDQIIAPPEVGDVTEALRTNRISLLFDNNGRFLSR